MGSPAEQAGVLSPLKRALLALDDMKARLDAAERAKREPIAIVGVGCRFPRADNPEGFWELLRDGVDAVTEVPLDRWDADAYFDPDPNAQGKSYGRWGAFLDHVDQFDPQFFGIAPREAAGIDPQQRLLLEVTWEAMEHAGIAPDRLAGTSTGVFIGICSIDYAALQLSTFDLDKIDAYSMSGNAHSIAAGRLAYVLGLQGPAIAIDTACSSSLVAVHLACQSLRNEECRTAVAAGVHVVVSPLDSISFSRLRMLAADGRCKTFDARGDGFVEGEGCGVVVLKRLSDAIADGDRIVAVIRGSAVNQDGASSSLTAPNGPSQESVIRAALKAGGVRPEDVGYVEAHGTGTALGDPIEVQALASVLAQGRPVGRPLLIGSVKTNIGHTQGAAGIAGLIKLALALDREEIPPTLHFRQPNPHIPWNDVAVRVATERTPWRRGERGRFAGVSSFGFSGTNAHIVLEEAPLPRVSITQVPPPVEIVTVSGKSDAALRAQAAQFAAFIEANPDVSLGDLSRTANAGRADFVHRVALLVANVEEARTQLAAVAAGEPLPRSARVGVCGSDRPRIAFLFTGQGAQYAGMGRELYEAQPVFREALDRCAELLQPHMDVPLLSVMYPDSGSDGRLNQTAYAQTALFAIEYALAEMWRSWGIVPSAVLGHSIGEYVAACVAGVFTLEDALRLVAARGRLMQSLPQGGAMAAVFADEARVAAAIAQEKSPLAIAAINSSENVVVSGAAADVASFRRALEADGIRAESLTVSHAFHSPLMDPILDEFERVAREVRYSHPRLTIISNLSGRAARNEITAPAYWRRHLREPVRFADGLAALHTAGYRVFLEAGPRATLAALGRRAFPEGTRWLASLRKVGDDWRQILESLGELYTSGAAIDWLGFDGECGHRIVDLPTYPFQRQRCWMFAGTGLPRREAAARPASATEHPLLGVRVSTPLKDVLFESELSTDAPAFLVDHAKNQVPIFPATAYLEMGFAAAREVLGGDAHAFEELAIVDPLVLGPGRTRVQVVLSPNSGSDASFQLFSAAADPDGTQGSTATQWRLHGTGAIRVCAATGHTTAEPLESVRARCRTSVDVHEYYTRLSAKGHQYGPAFQAVESLWCADNEACARLVLPAFVAADAAKYRMHPILLDAALQVIDAGVPESAGTDAATWIPASMGRVQVHRAGQSTGWAHARLHPSAGDADTVIIDVCVYDDEGRVIAEVKDMSLRRMTQDAVQAQVDATVASWLHEVEWRKKERDAARGRSGGARGTWIVLGASGDLTADLVRRIERDGGRAVVVRPGDRFESSDRDVRLNPSSPDDFRRMLAHTREAATGALEGVVHLWNLESGIHSDADSSQLAGAVTLGVGSLLHVAQTLVSADLAATPRLWVVTSGAAPAGGDAKNISVAQAPVFGLARSISVEHPELRCTCVDVNAPVAGGDAEELWREFVASEAEDLIAFRERDRYVARLVRSRLSLKAQPSGPVSLDIEARGTLDKLALRPARRTPPAAGEVEIAVAAAGLNFRDVLNALGMYEGPAGPLGAECVGTVTAIGEGVTSVQVGDQVLGMVSGGLRTHVTTPATTVTRTPAHLTPEEAATIPVAFLTAEYTLARLGEMKRGDRVLIHAAAGGVGLAAVQIAQRAGAEIFATAGSPEKHAVLHELGVRHVFSSRTLDFAEQIAAATAGQGVDLVLNSLTGEFIDKSLSVLRQGGRFLEIGRAGIWSAEQMAQARPDVAYFPVYLGDVDANIIQDMWRVLLEGFTSGTLRPLRHQVFELSEASRAFRHMAAARHIGKIVFRVGADAAPGASRLRGDASYLISGGLGALGTQVARWMVENGARHVVLTGRGAPSARAQQTIEELERAGARVMVARADVSRDDDVAQLVADIAGKMPPLRGVIHAAGVIDDGVLVQQSWPRFEKVFAPKVWGAWNLHRRTAGLPLDFFVMFSSMVTVVGAPGQSNYAAANAFLDALAQHRHASGLPALTINWGPWADSGMAAGVDERDQRRWRAQGVTLIRSAEGLTALGRLLDARWRPPQVAVLPLDWGIVLQRFAAGEEPPFVSDLAAGLARGRKTAVQAEGRPDLLRELVGLPANQRRAAALTCLHREAVALLGLEAGTQIDVAQPLRELGLDSLMSVELRNTIAELLKSKLPATFLFKYPTLQALADYVVSQVPGAGQPPQPGSGAATVSADTTLASDAAAELEPLSDAETRRLLDEELKALASWTGGDS